MFHFKFYKNLSLMKSLIFYFFIIILLMFSISVFSNYRFKSFYNSFYNRLTDSIKIQAISTDMNDLYKQIDDYAHSGDASYIKDYESESRRLLTMVRTMKAGSENDSKNYYRYRDIYNMLLTFHENGGKIIKSFDTGTDQIYLNQSIVELTKLKNGIQDEINGLLLIKLDAVQNYYSGFLGRIDSSENLLYIITAFITILCLFFAFQFSRKISIPIHQLALRLKKVAGGDLDVGGLTVKSNYEINILVDSFYYMISQLKKSIDRIQEKANVENQLKLQEIKNLELSNLLKQSELNFLQSQINPHFLFNTLNSISVLAEIGEAGQTKMMIDSLSNILRYNLRKLNDMVTLKEELEIIQSYLYIQKIRYGNRIKFVTDIDENVLSCAIPSMIIQPFVENSIIHGLEPKIGEGMLELRVLDCDERIEIMIRDNGVGMQQKRLDLINDRNIRQDFKRGIGVVNVMRRLEIFYGDDIIYFESKLDSGTTVTMRLPKKVSVQ